MTDIFKDGKEKVMPVWAKFVNAGDTVQGTYVGKIVGQIDGYGNEQVIYQLLQDDGTIKNVGFGINKKVINQDMMGVSFGQIVGFKYKGKVSFVDKFGKTGQVNDYSIFQDPKIVDTTWLKENASNMPSVVDVSGRAPQSNVTKEQESALMGEDVPFSSASSSTNSDKEIQLQAINKLAKEKLGATDANVKEKVMETTGVAFIPVNFQKIAETLAAM
jgi:hypothetical protein